MRRINVSAAFFLSIEFQQTGYFVHRFYAASYAPSQERPRGLPRFNEFLPDTQEIGRGIIVGADGWEQALEQRKEAFAQNTSNASGRPTSISVVSSRVQLRRRN